MGTLSAVVTIGLAMLIFVECGDVAFDFRRAIKLIYTHRHPHTVPLEMMLDLWKNIKPDSVTNLTKDDVENILKLLQKWNKHIEGEVWKQIFTNLPYLSTRLRAVPFVQYFEHIFNKCKDDKQFEPVKMLGWTEMNDGFKTIKLDYPEFELSNDVYDYMFRIEVTLYEPDRSTDSRAMASSHIIEENKIAYSRYFRSERLIIKGASDDGTWDALLRANLSEWVAAEKSASRTKPATEPEDSTQRHIVAYLLRSKEIFEPFWEYDHLNDHG